MTFRCGYLSGGVWVGNSTKEVLPCCFTNTKRCLDKTKVKSDNIINHPILIEMREQAKAGQVPLLCQGCVEQEKTHGESPRTVSLDLKSGKFNFISEKIIVQPQDVQRLYISLGNVCNFKCIMCSESQSHLIAKELGIEQSLNINNSAHNILLNDIDNMNNLTTVQFTGGEPFYNKKRFLEFLDHLPKTVRIEPVHTNGSIYDEEILDRFTEFKHSIIAFSFDGLDSGFEYQRPNSEWKVCKDNLFKIYINYSKTNKNISLQNSFTATAFTIDLVPKFIKEYHMYFDRQFFYTVKHPVEWQINILNPEYLFDILHEIEYFFHLKKFKNIHGNLDKLRKDIQQAILNPPSQETVDKFWERVQYMKDKRGVDINEKVPHLIEHLRR